MRRSSFVLFTFALTVPMAAAHAAVGLNLCGPGTYPPGGLRCGSDQLLLGYRDASGPCFWVCCPPNSDGKTYDCSGAPVASDARLDLRAIHPDEWQGLFTPPSTDRDESR